jgi:TonB family protein
MLNTTYPINEKENGIQGTVYILFEINPDGQAENFRVSKSASPGLDSEALRVVRLMKNSWAPAIIDGKPVRLTMTQPVSFILR